MSDLDFKARILIIGSGVTSLITAKTLLDDGYSNLEIVTVADRVGGVWASGPWGAAYPSLTSEFVELWTWELRALCLGDAKDKTEGRIKAETVTEYLEDFYKKFVEGRLPVRFGRKVVYLDRPEGKTYGWIVRTQDVTTLEVTEEAWDKVILAQGPHSNPSFPENVTPSSGFKGILVHSSQVHSELDSQILALPKEKSRVVVVGMGKSSIDLAARYASLGKEAKNFAGPSQRGDNIIKSRIISTLYPDQKTSTIIEFLIHKTPFGAWWLHRFLEKGDKGRSAALKVTPESPLYRHDPHPPIWRGPESGGGRSSLGENSFHFLVHAGKIKCIPKVYPVGISEDGNGLVLSNGSTIEADAILLGTGFKSSFDFIPLGRRIQLGIEPVPAKKIPTTNPTRAYWSLSSPPAPPRWSDPAPEVYKGLIPIGAYEQRDIATNGFAALLGCPYTAEIASHWISSFFSHDSTLRAPATSTEALDYTLDHTNWIRARYPTAPFSWDLNKWAPMLNAQQFNDGLLEDLQLEPFRQERGWFGLGYYSSLIESSLIKNLGEERRRVRERRSSNLLARLVSDVSRWVWGKPEDLKKKVL
ncbi:hypothetical protein BDY24DRAFT_413183 [Mrakia frigida]|uniref:uncharacterized protein n=1 Tax=Mrakia frigida TaxID=29902 RepID=UPI003FCBF684